MKIIEWIAGIIAVLFIGFYVFNSYIYTEKQGDTSMQNSTVMVHPISHASLVLMWGDLPIYVDPVGSPDLYNLYARPKIVVITHEHQDHFSTSTLAALVKEDTAIVAPQDVADILPENLKQNLTVLHNGEVKTFGALTIQAIPAYNLREEALQFHPKGRDNGYVLEADGTRVYIAGDTEDVPEMRALEDIDIAFVPMNLPYTMTVEKAADAVLSFKPKTVYPYHYRGQGGLSDVNKFKELVGADPTINVVLANWYPN